MGRKLFATHDHLDMQSPCINTADPACLLDLMRFTTTGQIYGPYSMSKSRAATYDATISALFMGTRQRRPVNHKS
jgi:hypothetical protein